MADKSSYLQYLPPVLWADEPDDPELSLGGLLRIFEKVLTGIDDGVDAHPPITRRIAELGRLFDPWKAPADFLPWLASWVALEFPTLQGRQLWDEYQRRKVTAEIAQIYRRRGRKVGLATYLDLYAVGQSRPRVAIDDGSRVLATRPRPGEGPAPVTALVTRGSVLDGTKVVAEGLLRPWCVARGADGSLFVGDAGVQVGSTLPLPSRVWRLDAAGNYPQSGTPPVPRPLAAGSLPLTRVQALAVRPAQGNKPETLYVLDRTGRLYTLPAPYTGTATEIAALAGGLPGFRPVAMVVDRNGDLLVLDAAAGGGTANPPRITAVRTDPVAVQAPVKLTSVVEPLSLLVRSDGSLIVGDAGPQEPADGNQRCGNLVKVDRTNPASWVETRVLAPADPLTTPGTLVAPTAITAVDDTHLHVLDVGLKPLLGSVGTFVVPVARPACVYRVDLGATPATPATVTPVVETGQMVFPTGMVADGGRLVVCDPGQLEAALSVRPPMRARPFHFEVVVHFTEDRLPPEGPDRTRVVRQVLGNIRSIVDEQRPAHTVGTVVSEG